MKRLTAVLLTLVLVGVPALTLADRDRHERGHHGGHYNLHGKYNGHHGKHKWHNGKRHRRHHGKHHGRHHRKHHGHWGKHHKHAYKHHGYHSNKHHYGYHYDPYLPLGAALVGSALGYTFSQSGQNCYGNCSTTTYGQTTSSNISGCYRIERYPDGGEYRVELPTHQCY